MKELFDILVIGGGAVGSAVARELSRYRLKIGVLEKELDVCMEASGRNSAVCHAGFTYNAGSLKAKLCVEGCREMGKLSEELGFRFLRCGKVLIGYTPEDRISLQKTIEKGHQNGVTGLTIMEKDELRQRMPFVPGEFGMFSANSGVFDPFEYTVALAENAVHNGVSYYLGHEVIQIRRDQDEIYHVQTVKGEFDARWVINCAGLGCAKISEMLGIPGYRILFEKCDYIILDKRVGNLLPMPIYQAPRYTDKGIQWGLHLTNTIGGSVLVGPYGDTFTDDPSDYSVLQKNIEILAEQGSLLWPHIHKKDYIRNYCGTMPKWVNEEGVIQDFHIEVRNDLAPHAINLVGIESPGITASIAIARYVVDLLKEYEALEESATFDPIRKPTIHFCDLSREEQARLIAEDPNYGEIICRCENVTKAEILTAIRNPLGAHTMVGVKYRTHAMMGRCQGGYCQMRIEKLIEQETGASAVEVNYARENSPLFFGKVREEAE